MRKTWIPAFAGTTALLIAHGAWAQSKLPPCPGKYAVNTWTNCYGTNMTNSRAIYRGEWLNDKFEGQGTYTYRNNAQYVGGFHENKRHGRGTYTWPDGARYSGEYKDDLRDGKGIFTYPKGERFVGEFRNDKRNGPGTEYGADGKVLRSGVWKDDVLVESR